MVPPRRAETLSMIVLLCLEITVAEGGGERKYTSNENYRSHALSTTGGVTGVMLHVRKKQSINTQSSYIRPAVHTRMRRHNHNHNHNTINDIIN